MLSKVVPQKVASANCSGEFLIICCDVINIESFQLPMNFIFGVTESAQGNTHGAALLGFSDSLPQYRVDAVAMSTDGLSLSVGSSVPSDSPAIPRALRMLWFIISKHQ